MDFTQEDFDLLTKLKKLVSPSEWQELMDRRLDVIHRNLVYTEGGGGNEAKEASEKAIIIYENLKLDLKNKYQL